MLNEPYISESFILLHAKLLEQSVKIVDSGWKDNLLDSKANYKLKGTSYMRATTVTAVT